MYSAHTTPYQSFFYLLGSFDWFLQVQNLYIHQRTKSMLIVSKCTWSGVHARSFFLSICCVNELRFAHAQAHFRTSIRGQVPCLCDQFANVINAFVCPCRCVGLTETLTHKISCKDESKNKTNRQFVMIVRVIWCNESMANCSDQRGEERQETQRRSLLFYHCL